LNLKKLKKRKKKKDVDFVPSENSKMPFWKNFYDRALEIKKKYTYRSTRTTEPLTTDEFWPGVFYLEQIFIEKELENKMYFLDYIPKKAKSADVVFLEMIPRFIRDMKMHKGKSEEVQKLINQIKENPESITETQKKDFQSNFKTKEFSMEQLVIQLDIHTGRMNCYKAFLFVMNELKKLYSHSTNV